MLQGERLEPGIGTREKVSFKEHIYTLCCLLVTCRGAIAGVGHVGFISKDSCLLGAGTETLAKGLHVQGVPSAR